ncbi:MAG: Mini-ribonuclease 3 [Clostridia bacterium]|nr:Mini-ribonuclease 3 [Clostridia bacterium]
MNPVVLAFVGDAVYSLIVRKKYAVTTDAKSGQLSVIAGKVVSAKSQAKLVDEHIQAFTEKEAEIFRRARNAKKPSRAKHSSVSEYNKSTGFEAVLGYLYLIGEYERLEYLISLGECDER